MRAVSSADTYEMLHIVVDSVSTNTIVYNAVNLPNQLINIGDELTFSNTGTPTKYTVTGIDYSTRTITFSSTPSASAGDDVYRFRASGSSYPVFSRYDFDLIDSGSYTPSEWELNSGYELFFLNGTVVNEQDYDIVSGAVTNFPAVTTGRMTAIQFAPNNLNTPIGNMANVITYTTSNLTYSFNYNTNAFDLFMNGCLLKQGTDYTTATNQYTLTTLPATSILQQQTFASAGAA
jgi:hypothetical protein